jgi:hypothetical protein
VESSQDAATSARDVRLCRRLGDRIRLETGLEEAVMTAPMQDQTPVESPREGWASRVLVREMWATVAIAAMWMAVLFVGVYGGDMTFQSVDSSASTIPSGVAVALFAAIGAGSVAKRVFGRKTH